MAVRLPLVVVNGLVQQLQPSDSIATPAVTVTQVEVDFGAAPVPGKAFALVDASVTPTSRVMAMQSGDAATGRQADENEMDPLRVVGRAVSAGNLSLYVSGLAGPVSGKFKINYVVG